MNTLHRRAIAPALALVLALALAACQSSAPARAAASGAHVTSAALERVGEGHYRASWVVEPAGAPVTVLLASGPDLHASRTRLLASSDVTGVEEFDTTAAVRPFVVLRAGRVAPTVVGERELPLAGGHNFRDLGGYLGADGRHVRWGLLYRSASMGALTEADYHYLGALGIRSVCDLRSSEERRRDPARWAAVPGVRLHEWDYPMAEMGLNELLSGEVGPDRLEEVVLRLYTRTPYEFADRYREMFAALLAGEAPLAFNCSAGKDRTGVAAALLLSALGVPRQTVMDDYLLSNLYLAPLQAKYASLPPAMSALATRVERGWLEAALSAIEQQDGSVEGYLEHRLGLGPRERAALRARYLE